MKKKTREQSKEAGSVVDRSGISTIPLPDPTGRGSFRSVTIARGAQPIPTFADFERLFEARAKGEAAIIHEVPDITSPLTVYSDGQWFSKLTRFEREHLAYMVRFTPMALGVSRKPFFRMLGHAMIKDGSIDLDDDDAVVRPWNALLGLEKRIGCKLKDLPSVADLDPTLLRMAGHCIQVSRAFKEKLSSEWRIDLIERDLKALATRGPTGRVAAEVQQTGVRAFHSRLRVETVDYFASLAEEACVLLAREARGLAFQNHPRRGPAATLRGLQNALFTRLVQDLMDAGVSRNQAVLTALELLALVVGEPYRGEHSYRFNRRNQIRWAAELGPGPK